MKNSFLLLLLILLTHTFYAQESASPNKGYFTLSAEYGYGYYWDWDNSVAEETNIRLGGQYLLSSQDKFGYSARLTLSRTSKNDKLSYGAGYYYFSATGQYDGNYVDINTGAVKASLLDFGVSESGHTFFMHLSPTLYRSESWRLSTTVSTGFIWASLESISIPINNRPVTLKDRTAKNAGFLNGYLGVSATASYAINPYYRVFGRVRWNFRWDVGKTMLVEPTVGIELPIVRGGRRFVPRG